MNGWIIEGIFLGTAWLRRTVVMMMTAFTNQVTLPSVLVNCHGRVVSLGVVVTEGIDCVVEAGPWSEVFIQTDLNLVNKMKLLPTFLKSNETSKFRELYTDCILLNINYITKKIIQSVFKVTSVVLSMCDLNP